MNKLERFKKIIEQTKNNLDEIFKEAKNLYDSAIYYEEEYKEREEEIRELKDENFVLRKVGNLDRIAQNAITGAIKQKIKKSKLKEENNNANQS